MARVPKRPTMVLRKLQLKARVALVASRVCGPAEGSMSIGAVTGGQRLTAAPSASATCICCCSVMYGKSGSDKISSALSSEIGKSPN